MQIITNAGYAEQTINKSKFLAWAAAYETEREVAAFLRTIAQKHSTAHHLAYAFRIKTDDGIVPRFSDAGEPSGTAGKPILQILDGQNFVNVCVAVIRYYGGVNLGTGGLVKAYGGTAKSAIEKATIASFVEMETISIKTSYKQADHLVREVARSNGTILDKKFDQDVYFTVKLPKSEAAQLAARFQLEY